MPDMDQLFDRAKRLLQDMDPVTRRRLTELIRQNAGHGKNTATSIQHILQNMDEKTMQRLEQQMGVHLDPRKSGSLSSASISELLARLSRHR